MSKYVELKPLFKILGERGYLNIETGFEEEVLNELEQSLPTIDIVHCADCKYYGSDGGAIMECEIYEVPTEDNHYCAWGERLEE